MDAPRSGFNSYGLRGGSEASYESSGTKTGETASVSLPDSFFLASEPAGKKSVKEVRDGANSGDEIVITGKVGGDVNAFIEGRAVFTIVDLALKDCAESEMEEGGCPTPWDYCCEDKTNLAQHTATIELRDGEKPYSVSVQGLRGLEHQKVVVIQGTAHKDEAGNLTIVAKGLWMKSAAGG